MKKQLRKLLIPLLSISLLAGCGTFLYSSIVTVTSVVDDAMKQWAVLSTTHQTTPDFDNKVIEAHDKYRQAAAVAEIMLQTAKANGQTNNMTTALQVAKDGAVPLIDLITSIMQPTQAASTKLNLQKASKP